MRLVTAAAGAVPGTQALAGEASSLVGYVMEVLTCESFRFAPGGELRPSEELRRIDFRSRDRALTDRAKLQWNPRQPMGAAEPSEEAAVGEDVAWEEEEGQVDVEDFDEWDNGDTEVRVAHARALGRSGAALERPHPLVAATLDRRMAREPQP